jgi:prevent-host-death family protein
MKSIKTLFMTELRANLKSAMEEIKKGKSIIVSSRGKPVAQLIPPPDRRKEAIARLESLRKTAIIGDIVSPTGEKWEAM